MLLLVFFLPFFLFIMPISLFFGIITITGILFFPGMNHLMEILLHFFHFL